MSNWPALLYGVLLVISGIIMYLAAAATHLLLIAVFPAQTFRRLEAVYGCSGLIVWIGVALACLDLFVMLPGKRRRNDVGFNAPRQSDVTVVLTAYNDAESIGLAVDDFRSHPRVRRVIVIDNNSSDETSALAAAHGATVYVETKPGYGQCAYRALREGAAFDDTELTLLCEGDMTFRAYDIDKFLAYIPHADIVNGTRIVEQLRSRDTQLTTFMYYGNFFVGKLLEAKHIGKGTFTDVGTTYKLCRNEPLRALLPHLNPYVNLEFNAHFLDVGLSRGVSLLECPVTFHNRVGTSKGGNVSNVRALQVGARMMKGIVSGWNQRPA